ncbi:hypothetical protein [Caldimonas sp. KR1-144]|uniref:hypothetical protein n=1 Tax=Caldimonas sp. KR1-144 TaxID=3400911 RepID=UPI003C095122
MNFSHFKPLAARALLGLALVSCLAGVAQAHGDGAAKHGGIVKSANDLSFELAGSAAGATVYIEDHGEPLAAAGFSGKLTVLRGGQKLEGVLQPGKANELVAAGLQLASGDRAVVVLTTPQKQVVSVRFAMP